jgi:CheY-like chemotaxis protein
MHEQLAIEITRQIGAIATALVWPVLAFIVLVRAGPALKSALGRLTEFALKGGGVEISAKVAQEIVANISAAEAREVESGGESGLDSPPVPVLRTEAVQKALENAQSPGSLNHLRSAAILWVDDKPNGNFLEMDAFRKLGISIDTALSSEEAEEKLKQRKYDLIITDLRRGDDSNAGLTFIKTELQRRPESKILVYTNFSSLERRSAVMAAGAKGMTSRPSELFALVIGALQS